MTRILKQLTITLACASALMLTPTTAQGVVSTIQLFNTGVGASGSLLGNNVVDAHYALISAPSPYTTAMTGNGANDFAWLSDGPSSRWIGVTPWLAEWVPVGTYVYRTTFDLSGFDPTSASIALSIAADNGCKVLLNGVDTGILTSDGGFTSFANFSLTSGFVNGINTLDFEVSNITTPGAPTHNPTGLRVELSGSATLVPEPTSTVLIILGVVLVAARRRV